MFSLSAKYRITPHPGFVPFYFCCSEVWGVFHTEEWDSKLQRYLQMLLIKVWSLPNMVWISQGVRCTQNTVPLIPSDSYEYVLLFLHSSVLLLLILTEWILLFSKSSSYKFHPRSFSIFRCICGFYCLPPNCSQDWNVLLLRSLVFLLLPSYPSPIQSMQSHCLTFTCKHPLWCVS